jgi:hypothetical protein
LGLPQLDSKCLTVALLLRGRQSAGAQAVIITYWIGRGFCRPLFFSAKHTLVARNVDVSEYCR